MPKTAAYCALEERLGAGDVIVLDAGVATEIESRGVPMTNEIWAARSALDHFEAVVETHLAYIAAGADIITANTYATSRLVLAPKGLDHLTRDINTRSLEAALTARERAGRPDVLVAGSISHFIAIPTGAEVQPNTDELGADELLSAFTEMREFQEAAGVDVILLEMMALPKRMTEIFKAVGAGTTPAWCGYSVLASDDGRALTGRHDTTIPFSDLVTLGIEADFPVHGVLHSPAEIISDSLSAIREQFAGPMMAYPDSGFFKSPNWQFVDVMSPADLAGFSKTWIGLGAQVIGGCCGLGPDHTRAQRTLADEVNASGL
ncbi:MAG: homocysteine S-methyltransferase family protein [Pseudomonadota bacterium]